MIRLIPVLLLALGLAISAAQAPGKIATAVSTEWVTQW